MLVSVYRNGPLRHGLSKGYVMLAGEPARVAEEVARDSSLMSVLGRHRLEIRRDARRPAALWLDTGPVWLADQEARARLRHALADAVAAVADAVARYGGALLPCAARAAALDKWSWLGEDRHSVEVTSERQREVCSNLFRRWVPELIALSGRAAFGGRSADPQGSRRLADATDQVPARFIASASPMHLERVREALRRDEGVSRLDVMDINPLGDVSVGLPSVEVRCVDAQAFPVTAVSHAILLQALAMQARRREKEGGRFPATPQAMLDRNRSLAIASGLAARLQVEGARRAAREEAGPRTETAAGLVHSMIRGLVPELRAMEVTAAELMPVVGGLSLRDYFPDAVRTENDLFASWIRADSAALDPPVLHALLSDRGVLVEDQITRANDQMTPGGTAVVEAFWNDLLRDPGPDRAPARRAPRGRPGKVPSRSARYRDPARDDQQALAEATLAAVLRDAPSRDSALTAVRRHLAAGWRPSLVQALKQADPAEAKQIRRGLRPAEDEILRLRDSTDIAGRFGPAILRDVSRTGSAFVVMDLPAAERPAGIAAVRAFGRTLPEGVRPVLVSNAPYQAPGDRRVSVEFLVLDMRGPE
jgi:hypothetical protein